MHPIAVQGKMPPAKRPRTSAQGPAVKKSKLSDTEPENDAIPQLNDDCLREIFSHLSLKDLCAVKNCSRQFSDLADSTVQSRLRDEIYQYDVSCLDKTEQLVLAKFGKCIAHLHIYGDAFDDKTFSTQFQKCTSLKTLRLAKMKLAFSVRSTQSALQNVENLELHFCKGSHWHHAKITKACPKLKKLTLKIRPNERITNDLTVLNDHQNVEFIHITSCKGTSNDIKILQQLKKLKKLTFYQYEFTVLYVTNHWLDLSSTGFDTNEDFFMELNKFTHLELCELITVTEISDAKLALATAFDIEKGSIDGEPFVFSYTLTPKRKN